MTKLIISSIARRTQNPAIYSTVFGVLEKLVFLLSPSRKIEQKQDKAVTQAITNSNSYISTIDLLLIFIYLLYVYFALN